jgi:glutathione synthase/RimK-type ligase-like ATP-grasp enzyme
MKSTTNLDVLVVYSGELADSATNQNLGVDFPFPSRLGTDNYNQSYAYFLAECSRQGLSAGFSTSKDITGAGTCKSYWDYTDGEWDKVEDSCYAEEIFDKLSPTSKTKIISRNLLFSSSDVRPFNSQDLSQTFADKLKTYQKLPVHSIPTIAITDSSLRGVKQALNSLSLLIKNHPHAEDFGPAIFLKDRFGACGNDIYKISSNYPKAIHKILNEDLSLSYIIQPAVLYDQGFIYEGKPALTDIRLIFQNNQLIQGYIRIAKNDSYLCNEHKGGKLVYLDLKKIPKSVIKIAKQISHDLNKPHSLYALDFVMSNHGHVFLIEGNAGPGIDWNKQKPRNEKMSKQLITNIVEELARRTELKG